MPRTNIPDVLRIIETTLNNQQVSAFVDDASLWVTEELSGEGLSEERLELIERYLACALIRIRDVGFSDVTMDDVRENFQVDPEVTEYLLRAAAMDPTGKLKEAFLEVDRPVKPKGKFRVGKGFDW